jgi:succinyl-diaminopimelate desuccinylase
VDFAPSGSADLGHPLLEDFIAGSDDLPALDVRPKQAWTDVARFGRESVAAANFGPGSPSQAHQRTEHVKLPLLVEGYERLEAYLTYTS